MSFLGIDRTLISLRIPVRRIHPPTTNLIACSTMFEKNINIIAIMKYVGIRGHRGAGKTTISYLLGNTINYLVKHPEEELSDDLYRIWCDDIIKDEKIIHECGLDYVYFESFSDILKLWVKLLLGCPTDYMYDDYYKDHMIINLKDFSYKPSL